MTFYNNYENINLSYLSNGTDGLSGWSTPLNWDTSFTGWSMPEFTPAFNVSDIFNSCSYDFSKLFAGDSPIWNNFNFNSFQNNNFNWNNGIFNSSSFPLWNFGDTFSYSKSSTASKSGSSSSSRLVNKAKSYIGKVNSDKEGNRLFSNGVSQKWCADFVSYNVLQTYGSKLPSSFKKFSSVDELREWGQNNGCYKSIPSSNKAQYIAQNVKPGDIMIEKKGGKSHTGIVTKVNSDGSFETVEGNCGNKVAAQKYNNSSTLSGFISLDKYA